MRPRRLLRSVRAALVAQRGRALASAVSVAVGVAALVVIRALGAGAEADIETRIAALGTHLLVVRPADVARSPARPEIRGRARTLTLDDAAAVAALPQVAACAPGVERTLRVKAGASAMMATVIGTDSAYFGIRRFVLAGGRFLDRSDDQLARRVAVLGSRVRATLYGDRPAIGGAIHLGGVPFEVVGILTPRGVMADGSDFDGQLWIPTRTALRRLTNRHWLDTLYVSAVDAAAMGDAERQIADLLRARHQAARPIAGGGDDFAVQNTERFLRLQQRATAGLSDVGLAVAGLILLVGGFGILASMLLAVGERRSEIGLRMALGARPRDVLLQFLLEALALALGGWLIGTAAAAMALTIGVLTTGWRIASPVAVAGLALLLVAGLGAVFGAIPARRAAILPPAEALRT